MIRHVCVINNNLKMSKGKIARVCLNLGIKSHGLLSFFNTIKWRNNLCRGIVLKTDNKRFFNIKDIIKILEDKKIRYVTHYDAGLTQVQAGALCGIAFFCDDENITKDMKLL